MLYVLPRFQRQGVATQLFVAIEQIIPNIHIKYIWYNFIK
ncbi:hypothetical protein B0A77_10165 [Flavobacterium branchiophilum]|uniref:N-acetyltransferase domain-containing protein n=1 Tax=Flavobacterium branchiophilum TaxID=55197 RepID=A0A2H3KHQ5_9FLAO|nr:hypothetical protein B0A77_10165 [Flavobacterium branchiophilum]